jgi:hypothetical protein
MAKWLNILIDYVLSIGDRMDCMRYGHVVGRILDEYPPLVITKNYIGDDLKNLVKVKPYQEIRTIAKCECFRCGALFLRERKTVGEPP